METENIIHEINQIKNEQDLRVINNAICNRLKLLRDLKSINNRIELNVGNLVQLTGLKRRMLNGLIVEIKEIARTRCTVQLPEHIRIGISKARRITVPLSCVQKI